MGAVVLCTFPAPSDGVKRTILDRVNRLIVRDEGRFLFTGSEGRVPDRGAWTVAVRLPSLVRASEVADEWREDPTLPPVIRAIVLCLNPLQAFDGADLLFP